MFSRVPGGGLRAFLTFVSIGLVLLLADGVYAGLRFRSTFTAAACSLKRATDALSDLDLGSAEADLRTALADIDAARSLLGHAGPRAASLLPFAADNLDALDSLARAAREAGRAGLVGTSAALALGMEDGSIGALYEEGRVRLDAFEEIDSALATGTDHLRRARAALSGAPKDVVGPIASARRSAVGMIEKAQRQLSDAQIVTDDLPGLLGARGERRYFLAFQAPSEARGGGGLIGVYGILRARAGELDLLEVAPIRDLVSRLRGNVAAPRWYRNLYGGVDGLGGWREANSSPTFPTAARVLLRMYARSTGDRLDGVLTMDPVVVSRLLEATGPVATDRFPEPVTADNADRLLMRDIYVRFEGREDDQNAFLRSLVDEVWKRFGSGDIEGKALARSLSRSIATQRLKFYSTDRSEADALAVLGIDGDPRRFGPRTQMLFHNNFAANKVDWFLHRSQRTKVVLTEDGDAHVLATLSLRNDAPYGRRSLLKKSDVNELPSGMNLMSVHAMLPEGARVEDMYFGSSSVRRFEGREAGTFPEVWAPLQLKVQDRAEVTVSYTVPDLVTFRNGRARLKMTFLPQALVRPDGFGAEIVAPSGYTIGKGDRNRLRVAGDLDEPRRLNLAIYSPSAARYPSASASLDC